MSIFEYNKFETHSILKISEKMLDSTVSPELKAQFTTLHGENVKYLIVDLSGVQYIDSSGLSAFLIGNRLFSDAGAFVLFGVTDHVMKLITISQLEKVITILPSKEEAVDYVFMTEIQKGMQSE